MQPTLKLASAGTLDGIRDSIGKFYYRDDVSLDETAPGQWAIALAGKPVASCAVRRVKGRFVFGKW